MDKTLNDYRNKKIMEHMNRDLTPTKEEAKNYALGHRKPVATKNMKEVFGVTNKSKLDTSAISVHVAKTPPKTGVAKKVTDTGRFNAFTPIAKSARIPKQDLNKTDISNTTDLSVHVRGFS
jgi:hypothetical protein